MAKKAPKTSSDIVPKEQNATGMSPREAFETLLLTLSNSFINLTSSSIDRGIDDALKRIGEFSDVDRCWIIEFESDGSVASNTFEWCAPGIESTMHQIQSFPVADATWMVEKLLKFETVHIPSVKNLPAEAEVIRTLCEAQDIQSLVAVPLIYAGQLVGIVGFDSVRSEKEWSQDLVNLLSIVGEMLVNALHRKRIESLQKDSDLKFRAVLEGLAEGLIIGDTNDTVLYVNSRMVEMTGYSAEELIGIKAYQLLVPSEEWYRVEGGTQRRFSGAFDRYELTIVRKDGTHFISEVSATPYRNSSGEIVGSIAALSDISAKKQAEQENERLQRQLLQAQKMEAVGQLAAGIAHDLNNSLGAVVGHLQIIRMQESLSSQAAQSVDIALTGCSRASTLINQLLSFSRQGKYDFKVTSIQHLIGESLDFLGKIVSPSVEIKRSGQLEDLFISADQAQLQHVITNLVINACHAMPKGGALNFSFSTTYILRPQNFNQKSKAGNFVVLTVSDTGSGIPEDLLSKIFDPFFTTKEEGEGSGLGLSMVYGIMQNHGGWIEVDSEAGMGTAFSLYFPQVGAPSLSLVERKENGAKGKKEGVGKILVIDDEPMLVELACNFLERAGFTTQPFSSPDEAFEWFRANHAEVSLVLLDMKMPGYNGSKSFKILREIDPEAQVVLISGYIDDREVHDLLDKGALSFIQKPVKYTELVAWISRTIKGDEPPARLALVH